MIYLGCGRYDSNYQTTILLPKVDMMYMEVGIRLLQYRLVTIGAIK